MSVDLRAGGVVDRLPDSLASSHEHPDPADAAGVARRRAARSSVHVPQVRPTLAQARLYGAVFALGPSSRRSSSALSLHDRLRPRAVEQARCPGASWLNPTPLVDGLVTVGTCSFLAGVFLTADAAGARDRELSRRLCGSPYPRGRAWPPGSSFLGRTARRSRRTPPTLVVRADRAGAVPLILALGRWVAWRRLAPAGGCAAPGLARVPAVVAVAAVLSGWGLGQYPWLLVDEIRIADAAGAPATLQAACLSSTALAAVLVLPSLAYLFSLTQTTHQPEPDPPHSAEGRPTRESTPAAPPGPRRSVGAGRCLRGRSVRSAGRWRAQTIERATGRWAHGREAGLRAVTGGDLSVLRTVGMVWAPSGTAAGSNSVNVRDRRRCGRVRSSSLRFPTAGLPGVARRGRMAQACWPARRSGSGGPAPRSSGTRTPERSPRPAARAAPRARSRHGCRAEPADGPGQASPVAPAHASTVTRSWLPVRSASARATSAAATGPPACVVPAPPARAWLGEAWPRTRGPAWPGAR